MQGIEDLRNRIKIQEEIFSCLISIIVITNFFKSRTLQLKKKLSKKTIFCRGQNLIFG